MAVYWQILPLCFYGMLQGMVLMFLMTYVDVSNYIDMHNLFNMVA
jgi:hypothetical protein